MSVHSQTFQNSLYPAAFGRSVQAPRGAKIAAKLFVRLINWVTTPSAPTPAEEAAALRRLAQQVSHTSPSFAADLMGAAARHELDNERA
jgi:hypothetical protein